MYRTKGTCVYVSNSESTKMVKENLHLSKSFFATRKHQFFYQKILVTQVL